MINYLWAGCSEGWLGLGSKGCLGSLGHHGHALPLEIHPCSCCPHTRHDAFPFRDKLLLNLCRAWSFAGSGTNPRSAVPCRGWLEHHRGTVAGDSNGWSSQAEVLAPGDAPGKHRLCCRSRLWKLMYLFGNRHNLLDWC